MRYPVEVLDEDEDNGTMPESLQNLADAVIGHRIVSAENGEGKNQWGWSSDGLVLTLDNGKKVTLVGNGDCCAYTDIQGFFLDPAAVDHMILGVGTTGGYTTWHIYADFGDIMRLNVGWSCGNPFYYGYGFDIGVVE